MADQLIAFLPVQYGFNITVAVYYVKDQHVILFNAIENYILATGKLRSPGRKSLVLQEGAPRL